jgi:hypothetical protein
VLSDSHTSPYVEADAAAARYCFRLLAQVEVALSRVLSIKGGSGAPWLARGCEELPSELVAADDPQVGPVLLCLQNCRLPLPGQILEGVSVAYPSAELSIPTLLTRDQAADWRRFVDRDHTSASIGASSTATSERVGGAQR